MGFCFSKFQNWKPLLWPLTSDYCIPNMKTRVQPQCEKEEKLIRQQKAEYDVQRAYAFRKSVAASDKGGFQEPTIGIGRLCPAPKAKSPISRVEPRYRTNDLGATQKKVESGRSDSGNEIKQFEILNWNWIMENQKRAWDTTSRQNNDLTSRKLNLANAYYGIL